MWSQLQQNIFSWLENGSGSAVVIAVAGSGKTTTIVECAKRLPQGVTASFIAFNKRVAEELKSRLPNNVQARTMNSLGGVTWNRFARAGQGGWIQLDKNKSWQILDNIASVTERDAYGNAVVKLVSLAKSVGLVPQDIAAYGDTTPLTEDVDEEWENLIDYYDVDVEEEDTRHVIALARRVLSKSVEIGRELIDFDDQLYLPTITDACKFFPHDFLFVDEAQDANMIQRMMIRKALKSNGRLVAVGDPAQAIYGFRGADTESIANIKALFGATELPLTVSYRCPKAVVQEAQKYVAHIQPAPNAALGSVVDAGMWSTETFKAGDAILCRNTAPLVEMAFTLIRDKVACELLGRDIASNLTSLIKKMKAKSIEHLRDKLDAYVAREMERFRLKKQEDKIQRLQDRLDTINIFVNELPETRRSVPELIRRIEAMFHDEAGNKRKDIVQLSTVHKAKGAEWQRVFILDRWELMPSRWAKQAWQKEQENNLIYVAVTRAKDTLTYIATKERVFPQQRKDVQSVALRSERNDYAKAENVPF